MPAAAQKPRLKLSDVRRWLVENYSLDGDLTPLPGECDLNLKLRTEDGEGFVCKISAAGEFDRLAAQHEVLARLNQEKLAAIPTVISSDGGASLVPMSTGEADYVGRLLSFVPGQPLAESSPYSADLIRDLGQLVGLMNRALAGYDHPAFHYRFDWDLANSMEVVEGYAAEIEDREVRAAVDQIGEDFDQIVTPRLGHLPRSVIHNDANDYNVLAEGGRVTGLIDFGDMVHSTTIADLAIAMAYASLGAEEIPQLVQVMASAYHEHVPVGSEEIAVLFPMMRMRLAVSACMAARQQRLRPDDPYLSISQEPIRNTLPGLMAIDVDEIRAMLEEELR